MKAISQKSIEIQKAFESLDLTANAIQLIKDVIRYGYWGDSDFTFNGETKMGNGYITNDAKRGGHFSGKQISGIMSGVAKAAKTHQCSFMVSMSDWWGDGTGDVLAFSTDFASYNELSDWAQTTAEEIHAAMNPVEDKPCQANNTAKNEHDERIKAVEDRRENYVAELKDCQDRKRIASLKRKIARANARLETLRSINGLFKTPEEK
jgi:hypothetical protein